MGLVDTFRSAAQKILDFADDVPQTITYNAVVPGVYTPATGVTADLVTAYAIRGLVFSLKEHELDWFQADWHMQKVIIVRKDMPLGLAPKSHDYFVIGGARWEIQRIDRVPTDAFVKFYIRRP